MRALWDTNIVIHRENKIVSNYSIGHLFRWLDCLQYDKVLHPFTLINDEQFNMIIRDSNTELDYVEK